MCVRTGPALSTTHSSSPPSGVLLGACTSEQVRCQAVVDALARQLPRDVSLEHISGTDIAKVMCTRPSLSLTSTLLLLLLTLQGDLVSIRNLLDIFGILLHPPSEEGEEDSNLLSSEGVLHSFVCVCCEGVIVRVCVLCRCEGGG